MVSFSLFFPSPRETVCFFAINMQFSSRWPCFNRQRCVCSAGCMDWNWSKACPAHNHINPRRKSRGLQGSETRGYSTSFFLLCGWSFGCWGFDFLNAEQAHPTPPSHSATLCLRMGISNTTPDRSKFPLKGMSLSINITWLKIQPINSPKDRATKTYDYY